MTGSQAINSSEIPGATGSHSKTKDNVQPQRTRAGGDPNQAELASSARVPPCVQNHQPALFKGKNQKTVAQNPVCAPTHTPAPTLMNTTPSTGSKSIYKFIIFKDFLLTTVHAYGTPTT